jgi:hypothetical protein
MPVSPRQSRRQRRTLSVVRLAVAGLLCLLLMPASVPALADTDAANTCATATPLPGATWHTESLSSTADVDWYKFTTTASTRALITLGNLAADERLDLYGACGTLLATSNRPAPQYEEIYSALPAGTFRVRVQHASGASSTHAYAVRVRLLSYTVQVLSSSGWLEYPNSPRIVGEVLNNTATPREDISVRIRFYNAAGALIHTGVTFARLERLPAWTRSMFVWGNETITGYDHYTVQVLNAPGASGRPFTALEVTSGGYAPDGFGGATYSGNVFNPSARFVGVPRVMLTIYDTYGRVSNADFNDTTPDPMAPYSSNAYEIYFSGHATANRMVFSTHGYPQ